MTNKDRAKKFADRYGFDISGQFKDDLLAQLDEACAEAYEQGRQSCSHKTKPCICFQIAWNAAREKGKGIVLEEYWNSKGEEEKAEEWLADKIAKMEP